jgi:hypothetical protein
MRRVGWLLIGLMMIGLAGCAGGGGSSSTQQAPPTVDITGEWQGNWVARQQTQGGGQIEMDIKQTGAKYTGNLLITGAPNDPSGLTEGYVTGNRVEISVPAGATGSLTVNGDEMSGLIAGMDGAKVNLKRVK